MGAWGADGPGLPGAAYPVGLLHKGSLVPAGGWQAELQRARHRPDDPIRPLEPHQFAAAEGRVVQQCRNALDHETTPLPR